MKSTSGVLFATLALALSAQAVTVVTTNSQTNGTNILNHTFAPSSIDLINGLLPTAQAGNFGQEGTGGVNVLTNGTFTSPITRDAGGPFQFGTFATGGNAGGTSLTYTLPAATSIGQINVFGGWQDGGRDQQAYSVLYSVASSPTTFIPLTTVDYNPAGTGNPQVTRVGITDTTGVLVANVAALRFDFNATENGYSGYAEIDVFASVPEPSRLLLLGFAMIGMTGRRRRQASFI